MKIKKVVFMVIFIIIIIFISSSPTKAFLQDFDTWHNNHAKMVNQILDATQEIKNGKWGPETGQKEAQTKGILEDLVHDITTLIYYNRVDIADVATINDNDDVEVKKTKDGIRMLKDLYEDLSNPDSTTYNYNLFTAMKEYIRRENLADQYVNYIEESSANGEKDGQEAANKLNEMISAWESNKTDAINKYGNGTKEGFWQEIQKELGIVVNDPNISDSDKSDLRKKVNKIQEDINVHKEQIDKQLNAPIYQEPGIEVGSSGAGSLDDMMSDADDFVKQGNNVATINPEQLQSFSQTLYNILLTVGIVVAVIVGGILGIKFMTSSLDEKAKVKQMLVAYVVGCAVVFGSFGIWKLVVTILQSV